MASLQERPTPNAADEPEPELERLRRLAELHTGLTVAEARAALRAEIQREARTMEVGL